MWDTHWDPHYTVVLKISENLILPIFLESNLCTQRLVKSMLNKLVLSISSHAA